MITSVKVRVSGKDDAVQAVLFGRKYGLTVQGVTEGIFFKKHYVRYTLPRNATRGAVTALRTLAQEAGF